MNKFQVVLFSFILTAVSACVYSQNITCNYDNKTLGAIITSLCTSAEKSYSIDVGVPINTIVKSCNVIDTPFEIVLKKILRDNNCMFELKNDCYYIYKIASNPDTDLVVSTPTQEISPFTKTIEYGMPQEDVISIMGKPDAVFWGDYVGSETYRYGKYLIIFKKKKIVGFDKTVDDLYMAKYTAEKNRNIDIENRNNTVKNEINNSIIIKSALYKRNRN